MPGQVIPRGKAKWLVRVYLGRDPQTGKRVYHNKTICGGKKLATEYLTAALRDRDTGTLRAGQEQTIGGLLNDLLLDYEVNGKGFAWASLLVERHLRPVFGAMPISRITTAHVNSYIAERRAKGRANVTINHELSLLRRSLNLGRMASPPKVSRLLYIPKLEEKNVRKGFFEQHEFLRLRAELPEELRPVLTFAYFTGCRRGEILSLQWAQVDLLERIIRLEPGTTKNEEARIIPMTTELYQVLAMQKAIRDQEYPACPWVFFRYGERIGEFKKSWGSACRRAGLWNQETGKPTKLFHDLRRPGVRNLIRAGVPERVAMQISGHKTRSILDRYNVVSEADLKDAMRRLDNHLEEQAKRARGTQPEVWHTIGTQGAGGDVQ